jgi:UPF0755 protein
VKWLRRITILCALAAAAFGFWLRETRLPVRRVGEPPLPFTVPQGATGESIGRQLQGLGLVRYPWVFRALVYMQGTGTRLRAGDYAVEGPLTLADIVEMLVRGETANKGVTFPEGRTLREMAEIVDGAGLRPTTFLDLAGDPAAIADLDPAAHDLEGYLFPDTYQVSTYIDAPEKALIVRMVQRFREVIAPERDAIAASGMTLRQIVTLASLVEMETARGSERPRIAGVFLNRLRKSMLLQTDPTIIYALREAGRFDGNIRKKDLAIDSPYNTYKWPGLPPGPIGAPGIEAIRAVLRPTPSEDLYFVSRNDGTHAFSRTLAEHNKAVNLYQRGGGALPSPEASAEPSPAAGASSQPPAPPLPSPPSSSSSSSGR